MGVTHIHFRVATAFSLFSLTSLLANCRAHCGNEWLNCNESRLVVFDAKKLALFFKMKNLAVLGLGPASQ